MRLPQNFYLKNCQLECFKNAGKTIYENNECSYGVTGIQAALLNCVFEFPSQSKNLKRHVHEVLDFFNNQNLPHSWWLESSQLSLELGQVLNENGLVMLGEFPGFCIDTSQIASPNKHASELIVELVETQQDYQKWSEVICSAFEFSDTVAEGYVKLFQQANDKFRHFVGKINGKVVSTGTLLCLGNVGYFYNLATLTSERNKGYATQVLHEALQLARASHVDHVGLISSPLAAPIYQRLGFQKVCSFNIFA